MHIVLPPEVKALVQRQITSGKYKTALLCYQSRNQTSRTRRYLSSPPLENFNKKQKSGRKLRERGEIVDGATAMAKIRANMKSGHSISP